MKRVPGPDWFLTGMAAAVGLAFAFPAPGAPGGWMHPELVNKLGVALVFFLHGLVLAPEALKAGALRWPLHLMVQGWTFLAFPLLGLAGLWLAGGWLPADLRTGFFYLCALPSTVSSSVALTAAARGNVPAAVFNASLSSVLGVVLTPLWVGWYLRTGGQPVPVGGVILDLVVWLLLPLAAGQLLRPLLAVFVQRRRKLVGVADRLTILLLVYTSFCGSVSEGVWTGRGWGVLAVTLVGCVALLAVVMTATGAVGRALGFPVEDRITAVFCGSKKTLASGVPMAHLIFGATPAIGLILLPILLYHPLQLVVCGVAAGRWARRD